MERNIQTGKLQSIVHISLEAYMEDFVDVKKSESYTISDQEEFIKELKGFLSEKESHCSDNELHLPSEISNPDLFEKNWKIEGVVVRKSDSRAWNYILSCQAWSSQQGLGVLQNKSSGDGLVLQCSGVSWSWHEPKGWRHPFNVLHTTKGKDSKF